MHSIQSLKDLAQLSTIMQHMSMCIYKLPLPIGQVRCQGFSLLTAKMVQLHEQSTLSVYCTVCTVRTVCTRLLRALCVGGCLYGNCLQNKGSISWSWWSQISIFVERCDEISDWCDCFLSASVTENTTTTSPHPRPQISKNEMRWRLSFLNANPPKMPKKYIALKSLKPWDTWMMRLKRSG